MSDAEADRLAAEARQGVAAQERARVSQAAVAEPTPVPRGLGPEDGHVKVKDGGGRQKWLLLALLLIGCCSCMAVGIYIGVVASGSGGSDEERDASGATAATTAARSPDLDAGASRSDDGAGGPAAANATATNNPTTSADATKRNAMRFGVSGNCADILTAQGQTGFLDALEGQVATTLDTGTKTLTVAQYTMLYN